MPSVTDHFGVVALNGATEVTVTLDERFAYQVRHTGLDASANDDANSAATAYLSYESGVTADLSEEDDKYPLMDGQSIEIGPGIATLYIDSVASADAVLLFARKDELTRRW
jgi:hypothetical protein